MKKTGRLFLLVVMLACCLTGCRSEMVPEEDKGELVRSGEFAPDFLLSGYFGRMSTGFCF